MIFTQPLAVEMKNNIEQLYEKLRLQIRALFKENWSVQGNLTESKMTLYNNLTSNIPEPEEGGCMQTNHQARTKKIDNMICNECLKFKTEVDSCLMKTLNQTFDDTEICFCCLRDLSYNDIYGSWNGLPWLCQSDIRDPPPINIEEIRKKIQKASSSKS